jgi:hypothetical protein
VAPLAPYDVRFDNIRIITAEPVGDFVGQDQINWGESPNLSDFDFDIQNSDEFGFDFDLSTGSPENFNSVTVTGGKEKIALDKTFAADGGETLIDLPDKVSSIAVFKNAGSDTSPSWTAQTVGIWGSDELSSAGGDKDVLYSKEKHWLLFNSAPANMTKSFRVTGFIEKPIRVRVENNPNNDPIIAVPYHDESITSEADAIAVGQARLNERREVRRLSFTTHNPGLKAGELITVNDSARGLSETMRINAIKTRWLGSSGHAEFTLDCGDDVEDGADVLLADIDQRTKKTSAGGGVPTTSSISVLQDSDNATLYDTDGSILFEIPPTTLVDTDGTTLTDISGDILYAAA